MKIFLSLVVAALCLSVSSTANAQIVFTFSTSATSATAGSVLNVLDGETGSLFVYVDNNDSSGGVIGGLALDITDSGTSVLTATLFDVQNPSNRWFTTAPGALDSSPLLVENSNAIFIPGFGSNTGIENGIGPVLHAELQFSANGLGSNTLAFAEGASAIAVGGAVPQSLNFGNATVNVITAVPEPSSLALVGSLFGAALLRRRRRN